MITATFARNTRRPIINIVTIMRVSPQEGQELMQSKPEFEPIVTDRLAQLHDLWDKLESTTQDKARLLFDANRSELFDQSQADMKKWLGELHNELKGDDEVKDLASANRLLKKHQVWTEGCVCVCVCLKVSS